MSAVYGRSLAAAEALLAQGIETFVPMRVALRRVGGKLVRQECPAVNNLLFCRCTREAMRQAKGRMPYLQFLVRREAGRGIPIVIDEQAMSDFIRLSSAEAERVSYFTPDEVVLTKGERVRLHGGLFDGVEGVFCRVAGKRARRFCITIDTLLGLALEIEPEYIERL